MSASSGFAVSPGGGTRFPTTADQNFPKQIQFRFNGVDLGGPDATTVDFVGAGFTVTRGTGIDAGKVTVELS